MSFSNEIVAYCEQRGWTYKFISNEKSESTEESPHRAFVATEYGAWKIVPNKDGTFLLLHHNLLKGLNAIDHPLLIPVRGDFYHKQRDAKSPFKSILKLLHYIDRHETSRGYEIKGVDCMPTHTGRQKAWKRQAKNRKRRADAKRVMKLFELI